MLYPSKAEYSLILIARSTSPAATRGFFVTLLYDSFDGIPADPANFCEFPICSKKLE